MLAFQDAAHQQKEIKMNLLDLLMVSKTSASVSALSSALRVMMSSFPAHFRIFDILEERRAEKVSMMQITRLNMGVKNKTIEIYINIQEKKYKDEDNFTKDILFKVK